MTFWHDSLIKEKMIETVLAIRHKAYYREDISLEECELYKNIENKLLDLAMEVQNKIEDE